MPSFQDSSVAAAAPEEVWKVLYDPSRFADWWAGDEYPVYRAEQPGSPRAAHGDRRVVMSCLKTYVRFEWRLASVDAGSATRISVHVEIPDHEAHLLDLEREVINASLGRLASVAATSAPV